MGKDTAADSWMDEYDPELQPGLTCHIEIENENGKTAREVAETTARALRALAAQIEAGAINDGHHPISLLGGKEIGTIYMDWHVTEPA